MDEGELPGWQFIPTKGDRTLGILVSLAEALPGFSVGVTLCVKGLVVAGNIISEQEYFMGLEEDLKRMREAAFGPSAPPQIAQHFTQMLLQTADGPNRRQDLEYIHLTSVRIYSGSSPQTGISGNLWRGPMAAIDGFIMDRPPY